MDAFEYISLGTLFFAGLYSVYCLYRIYLMVKGKPNDSEQDSDPDIDDDNGMYNIYTSFI